MLFRDARLKIERANQHIADVESRIAALPKTYVATVELNPQTGQEFIKHALPQVQAFKENLALIIGDAVHNLKTALDFAWVSTLERFNIGITNFSKFPIYPDAEGLAGALQARKINTTSPALSERVLTQIKPYKGGNNLLWAIHRLDIIDKHKLLIPLLQVASFHDIEVEDEQGHISKGGFTFLTNDPGGGAFFIPIPLRHKVKNKGYVAPIVVFDDGLPFQGVQIAHVLLHSSGAALKVVELLEEL